MADLDTILVVFSDIYLPSPVLRLKRGDPLELSVHIWHITTGMAGLQSGKGRMIIDSIVWTQYNNVTDTQTATLPQQ